MAGFVSMRSAMAYHYIDSEVGQNKTPASIYNGIRDELISGHSNCGLFRGVGPNGLLAVQAKFVRTAGQDLD